MTNPHEVERGKALAESGKYRPSEETGVETGRISNRTLPDTSEATDNPGPTEAPSLLSGMRDGLWLDSQEFPPLEFAVSGIVPEGFGLLVAPPKAGKSWLVGGIGLACAAGGLALGKLWVHKRPVLYLALEDGHRRLQSRFRRIMADQAIPAGMHVITQAQTNTVIPMILEFLEMHRGDQALIILDTLGRVKPPKRAGEESYSADYAIGSQLKGAIDTSPGSSLLVVHHSRKQESGDFVDAVSGTQGLAGSADFVLVLSRKRHSEDAILSVTGRDVPEEDYAMRADDGVLWRLDGDTLQAAAATAGARREQGQLADRSIEVLALVNQRAAAGDTTRASDLDSLGISQDKARVYLNRLADSDRIKKASRGLYTTVTTVTSVTNADGGPAADSRNVTDVTVVTPLFKGLDGPGRCPTCHWDLPTQGHKPDCIASKPGGTSA